MANSDSDDEEQNDELRRYNEHVNESEGFDVPDFIPKGIYFGLLYRVNLSNPDKLKDVTLCAKFAIKHYNHLPENNERKLKLLKVLKATYGYRNYNITLKARDDSGFVTTHETKVFYASHSNERLVRLFRPKRKKQVDQSRQEVK
ncbi:uncharacterized protein LOC126683170 isoform X2 [Mercurialis annua]|uniref:uncharacterized protein LOC126683170 isoform X2 n=1 Tax=Mercurialis annua TaxID=3986 RepID=UPI002160636F|nr:uncharacterized protein LOC126683170 isoform X2 [Mercurialis annua]